MSDALAELDLLEKSELRHHWQKAFGSAAPSRLSRDMMMLALGWRAQAKVDGGFNRETRESLARLIANLNAGKELMSGTVSVQPNLTPGTSLVREWHGTLYQVQILDKGFVWNGKVWNSLSAIAREITGVHWNGPAFFGLRSKRVKNNKTAPAIDAKVMVGTGVSS